MIPTRARPLRRRGFGGGRAPRARPALDEATPRYPRRGSRHRHPPDGGIRLRARPSAAPTGEPRDGVPQPPEAGGGGLAGGAGRGDGAALRSQRRAPRSLHLRGLWADPRPAVSRWCWARPGGALPRRARPHGRAHGPRGPRPERRALWPLRQLSASRRPGALPGTGGVSATRGRWLLARSDVGRRACCEGPDGGSALSPGDAEAVGVEGARGSEGRPCARFRAAAASTRC